MERPHPGQPMLMTCEEILQHAEADQRVLDATQRHAEKPPRWHGRLIHALRPYGEDSTAVGDALRRAAADLGFEADGRGYEALAGLLVGAVEAKGVR